MSYKDKNESNVLHFHGFSELVCLLLDAIDVRFQLKLLRIEKGVKLVNTDLSVQDLLYSEKGQDEVQKVLVVSLEVVVLPVKVLVFLPFVALKLLLLVHLVVLDEFLSDLFKVVDKVFSRRFMGQLTSQRSH